MKGVVRKLKSTRGASIIIALLVLLICITAGAAALTAAGANAGRYTHLRTDQQRYLAVSSAAKLVRGELAGQSFTATAELEENRAAELDDDPDTQVFQLNVTGGVYDGAFQPWLEDELKALFRATAIPGEWLDQAGLAAPDAEAVTYDGLELAVDGAGEPLLGQVKWSLTLDDDYTLTARFWLEDEGTTYYPTTLTLPAKVVKDETSEPEPIGAGMRWKTTKTFELTWDDHDAVITQS